MTLIVTIIAAILAIFFVVLIHELGHLLIAKVVGVKVERFSIGFGKILWSFKGGETEYAISALPLGGYVKMLGENDKDIPADQMHRAYQNKSILARMAIVTAGPITNFLLALVLFWMIFLPGITHIKPIIGEVTQHSIAAKGGLRAGDQILQIDKLKTPSWQRVIMALVTRMGDKEPMKVIVQPKQPSSPTTHSLALARWEIDPRKPDFLGSLGIAPFFPKVPPVIKTVQAGSPAERAGIKAGDEIMAIDGKPVSDWMQIIKDIQKRPKQSVLITVKRNNQTLQLTTTTGTRKMGAKQVGFLGVLVQLPPWPKSMTHKVEYSILTAWTPALTQVWSLTKLNGLILYKMVVGKVSPRSLGGPISILRIGITASSG